MSQEFNVKDTGGNMTTDSEHCEMVSREGLTHRTR